MKDIIILTIDLILVVLILILIITGLTNLITFVPYVPSTKSHLKFIIEHIKSKKGKKLYDLGCGDGRTLFLAEKAGLTATGYENSLAPYLWGTIKKKIIGSKVEIIFGSLFRANLHDADFIFVYLMPFVFKKLIPKIQKECKKGTIIISRAFKIESLEPYEILEADKKKGWPIVYFYKV